MNDVAYEIRQELQAHIAKEDIKFEELQADIKQLRIDMTTFTDAWQQAKGVVTFIKWVISIAGGVTAFILFIKDHVK